MRTILTMLVLVVTVGLGTSAAAQTFTIESSAVGLAAGIYSGQSFTVNDLSHTVTGTNRCTSTNCAINEWSWRIGDPSLAAAGLLYVDVYDVESGITYLGSSVNSVDVQNTGTTGQFLTWTFDSIQVNPSHLLIAEISFDNVSGNAAAIRLEAASDNVAGTMFSGLNPADVGFDSIYSATLTGAPIVPGLGGLEAAMLAGVLMLSASLRLRHPF